MTQLWTLVRDEEHAIVWPAPTHLRVGRARLDTSTSTDSVGGEGILRFIETPDFTLESLYLDRLTKLETETTTA